MSNPHKRVQVCIRVRPPLAASKAGEPPLASANGGSSSNSVVVNDKEHTISVVANAATGAGTCFHFDQVLGSHTTQAGVFTAAAAEIVDSVLSGYNGTIMAYGQTGAGKTFTMSGGKRSFEDRGVCARAISSIFQQIQRDAEHSYVVRVSYVEVYNETLFDLLNFSEPTSNHGHHSNNNQASTSSAREELVIQENEKGQTFIRGLTRAIVKTEEQAFDLLFQGETNRTIAEHCLNAASTRSHCIFTVYIEKKRAADDAMAMLEDGNGASSNSGSGAAAHNRGDVTVFSKLHLVDLAGSERMKKTHVTGVMLKEASHINKSLTFLEQVVIALGDKKRAHIPYRQTPLTNILKDSLGGNCRTMLIACVWPEDSHNDQTVATLKFATRMMRVKTSAIVNIALHGNQGAGGGAASAEALAQLQKLALEVKRLKEELALHDTLGGRSLVDYDLKSAQSVASRARYRAQIHEFLHDETKSPPIVNLVQTQQLLLAFRELCLEQPNGVNAASPPLSVRSGTAPAATAPPAVPIMSAGMPTTESRMVKQFRALRASTPPEAQRGTSLPLLVKRDPTKADAARGPEDDGNGDDDEERARTPLLPPIRPALAITTTTVPVDERSDKELFDAFKQLDAPRPESLLDLELAKQNLRQAKAQTTAIGLEINKLKLEIDGLTFQLDELRSSARNDEDGDSDSGVVRANAAGSGLDQLVLQLRDAKKQYRAHFERFQEKKAETQYLLQVKAQMLQRVTREFDAWKQNQRANVMPQQQSAITG